VESYFSETKSMKPGSRLLRGAGGRAAGAFSVAAFTLSFGLATAEPSPPIKLAVFDFELEDFSAASALAGSFSDRKYLALATDEARRLVAESERYSLVETSTVDDPAAKQHRLHECDACAGAIAAKLGADQALVGIVHRVSRTEYWIRYQIRDAKTGSVVASARTELRLGADYSWDRGARWLIQNRLLASRD
jgi:hypothetical protein